MANSLLQEDKGTLEIEEIIIEELLKRNKYTHCYMKTSLKNIDDLECDSYIPIGTIDFVSKYLNKFGYCSHEVPIEIPKYLQTDEFLKRDYSICKWNEIPRQGEFFLKDISQLKKYGSITNATYTDIDELFNYEPKSNFDATLILDKEHLYQVSSILPIKTEYRVYVIGHEIIAIAPYEGSPLNLPDIKLLQKAIALIQLNEKWLQSYTIDIAVGNFGTAILEIHNFTSVGLYHALWGSELLYAYVDGINYLKNDNTIKYI